MLFFKSSGAHRYLDIPYRGLRLMFISDSARGPVDSLRGKTLDEESIREGAAAILREAHFRTSTHRATAVYRQRLARVLLRQTLQTAWQRATQG
jgi:xanthine dehydrogenase iron-sulfur cluster and FAD-binding subunit A